MCSYLEMNDEEQLTVSYLRDKMKEYLISEDSLLYKKYCLNHKGGGL